MSKKLQKSCIAPIFRCLHRDDLSLHNLLCVLCCPLNAPLLKVFTRSRFFVCEKSREVDVLCGCRVPFGLCCAVPQSFCEAVVVCGEMLKEAAACAHLTKIEKSTQPPLS